MTHTLKAQHLAGEVLALLNRKADWDELIPQIVMLVKRTLEFEAVGLRLNDHDDYPYYFSHGFSEDFVRKENFLCTREPNGSILRDTEGNVVLECMCGNVIQGRTDAKYPFFTPFGSFWSNGTSHLLASTTETERQAGTRNRCNGEGYESMGLIPIRAAGHTHGLLQLNDRRPDMFTLPMVEFLEGLSGSIGLLMSLKRKEEELARRKADISRLVGVRTRELAKTVDKLMAGIHREAPTGGAADTGVLDKLQAVLDEIRILKGILPICCMCKRIRDEDGCWRDLEEFIHDRSGVEFTHGLCPVCTGVAMGKMD